MIMYHCQLYLVTLSTVVKHNYVNCALILYDNPNRSQMSEMSLTCGILHILCHT